MTYLLKLLLVGILSNVGGIFYRIRGGWLKKEYLFDSSNLAKLVWALPTGALLFMVTTPDTTLWYRVFLVIGFVYASMALYGHGAHMIFNSNDYRWGLLNRPDYPVTENLTSWWLPYLFKGTPTLSWSDNKMKLYNFTGMSFIGLIRHLTVVLPFVILAPMFSLCYALFGLLHGTWYLLGELIPKPEGIHSGNVAEYLVGFTTYAFIVIWWIV